MQQGDAYHIPVLRTEALELLAVQDTGIYVDATLGGGGYSEAVASQMSAKGKLFSFDTDPHAIAYSSERLQKFGGQIEIVRANFRMIRDELLGRGITSIDGVVYDLGVSSRQLDSTSIGLSYRFSGELDMRLDPRLEITAKEIIAHSSVDELKLIFKRYGEEPFSGRIARRIIEERDKRQITTTGELAEIVSRGIRDDKKNATLARIFQALRIEVNDELGALRMSLEAAIELLKPGGRIVAVSYHSLEDRIVKDVFNTYAHPLAEAGSVKSLRSIIDEESSQLKILTRKPLTPSSEEVERNPRSRSAKLRAAEKR